MLLLSFVLAAAVAVDAPTLPKEATPDWWRTVQKNIEASEYQVSWADRTTLPDLDAGWQAPNRAQGFRTYFFPTGIRVVPRAESEPSWEWGLALHRWGRGPTLEPALSTDPRPKPP